MSSETAASVAEPGLSGMLAAYDAAFAADDADGLAKHVAAVARLMWSGEEA